MVSDTVDSRDLIEDTSNQQGKRIMAEIRKYKLSDAIRQPSRKAGGKKGGKPLSTLETAAEQIREARESEQAGRAGVSSRGRMVDIGRGNQQSGRQGQ